MPSINDFLVVLIIPALDYIVYPHLEKSMGIKILPLHKVAISLVGLYHALTVVTHTTFPTKY